ncbi:MAG: UDP-glucose 4-epimerase [Thermoleophilaceae bacterium]|nr:UDP-glucose 4-epimerase [Thermoleophilaceae bacterium]
MRVVVTGASGNVGTSVLRSLTADPAVESVLGLCRRVPRASFAKVEWRAVDVANSPLRPHFDGADAVIHLAWLIQPARDQALVRSVNVDGSARVFAATAAAGVGTLVYASSVGAYGPGPKDRRVDESWPTTGIQTSFYSRHKAEVERLLDRFEDEHERTRVVRLRPALIFKREAASGIRRLFAGPLLPGSLLRPALIGVVPDVDRLVFQAVHSYDVGDAYRLAVLGDASGPFNIAAEPVVDPSELARILGARRVPVPASVLRTAAAISFKLRLQPSEPGWIDMALDGPLMDVTRAHEQLGWRPRYSSRDALRDLLAGLREGAGLDTPPLEVGGAGPLRARELLSGVGARMG